MSTIFVKRSFDPRLAQLGVPLLFTILGQTTFRFDITPLQVTVAVVSAWIAELLLARAADKPLAPPLSASISGLSVALLLRSSDLWPFALASFLAIASKYIFCLDKRHIFNPSNFGITAVLLLPYAGTRLDPGEWPTAGLIVFLLASLGVLVLTVANRLPLVPPFVVAWGGVLLLRAAVTGAPLLDSVRPLFTGFAILFAFFMLTDPRTTPAHWRPQLVFGLAVGLLAGVFTVFSVAYGIFVALAIVCLVYALAVYFRRVPSPAADRPASPARRALLAQVAAASASVGFVAAWPLVARNNNLGNLADEWVASGGGVNLKHMPDASGQATVPLRENFYFDLNQAICSVENNPHGFVMPTHSAGKVAIAPGEFFMFMVAPAMQRRAVAVAADGSRKLTMEGDLDCTTYAGTTSSSFGSRTQGEPASFHIEAVDGGGKPGPDGRKLGDSFAFTVYFLKETAPVNFAIFGPSATFTGQIVAGRVTIQTLKEAAQAQNEHIA
ncbi:MAG TPA: RnfABCDGE type electron transport complex subunit D [Chloroflexota bacterium]|nr:RnfABCDGE type electron transport complex subunit D [Chloroflexota bacterium]